MSIGFENIVIRNRFFLTYKYTFYFKDLHVVLLAGWKKPLVFLLFRRWGLLFLLDLVLFFSKGEVSGIPESRDDVGVLVDGGVECGGPADGVLGHHAL